MPDSPREEIGLKLEAFELQRQIIEHPARFKVVRGGRRWGKTEGGVIWVVQKAMKWAQERAEYPDAILWWLAPVLTGAGKGFSLVNRIGGKVITDRKTERGHRKHWFRGGAQLQYRATKEEPDNLRGEKVYAAVIDEAPQHSNYAWENVIYPSLIDCEADAYIIGSPTESPDNWFYQLYEMGLEENDVGVKSWTYPSWANPFLWRKVVEAPKLAEELFGKGHTHVPKFVYDSHKVMSSTAFQLEIAAKSGLTSSPYFQAPSLTEMAREARPPLKVEKTRTGETYNVWETPVKGKRYVIGADVSEGVPSGDWSVAYVLRRENREKAVQVAEFRDHLLPDRFGEVLRELGTKYNMAHILVEKNNPGYTTILRLWRRRYVNLMRAWDVARGKKPTGKAVAGDYGWRTDGHSKPVMLADLRAILRRRELVLNSAALCRECLVLRENPDGTVALGGRRGSKMTKTTSPDRIMALALAVQGHIHLPYSGHYEQESKEQKAHRIFTEQLEKRYETLTGKPRRIPSSLHQP